MLVEIKRQWETTRSVTGQMFVDGEYECFTLEPARVNPIHPGHPCIPEGTYKVVLTMSPHFGYLTPEVLNVPSRTAIRWHIANEPEELLGCTAVGTSQNFRDFVGHSRVAFEALMVKLQGQDITAVYSSGVK